MTAARERLLYIDNLRLMVIAFVVMHHLAVTYSGFGGWYYVEATHLDTLSTIWFLFYLTFQQGYFLGLLFLLAGYFVAGSYDRKGFGPFAREKFNRLLIPTLIYMIAIDPFIGIVELRNTTSISVIGFLSATGVMWFAAALFAFSLVYALTRLVVRKHVPASDRKLPNPTFANAVLIILTISIFAFLIRIVQPIGTNILNFQLSFFSSYIVLFIVGILAFRNNWFAKISYRTGKRWLISAVALGFVAWLALIIATVNTGNVTAAEGGLTWQSAGYSVWESFVAVAMSIGLIGVFREKFNHQTKLVKTLSDNSFAVYMFHPMIIIPVTLLFSPVGLYPILKWLLLCIICVPLCFAATNFVFRRIPLLKKVL